LLQESAWDELIRRSVICRASLAEKNTSQISSRSVFRVVICRNRAATAPCETGAVCIGWPLPQ
jgi:hypothetical protein